MEATLYYGTSEEKPQATEKEKTIQVSDEVMALRSALLSLATEVSLLRRALK